MPERQRRSLISERGGISPRAILGYLAPIIGVSPLLLGWQWLALEAQFRTVTITPTVETSQWALGLVLGAILALAGAFLYHQLLQLTGGLVMALTAGYGGYLAWNSLGEIRRLADQRGYTDPISVTVEPALFIIIAGAFGVIVAALLAVQTQDDRRSFDEDSAFEPK
jgi:hypothetical protein